MSYFLISFLILSFTVQCVSEIDYTSALSCNISPNKEEKRKLNVATCDSRNGIKGFTAMRVWNISGEPLYRKGLKMINVCTGVNWGKYGFLTKPIMYLEFIQKILNSSSNASLEYVLLMDSDTFWSTDNIGHIWKNFDCARGNKNVVAATEMQCWIGRYCSESDVNKFYNDSKVTSSYSMFLNSGVLIGEARKVEKMLQHIIVNNQSYYITFQKHKFDDQFAFVNYALRFAPEDIALDYHQYISSSFSIHTAMHPPQPKDAFVCKSMKTGNISMSCMDSTAQVHRKGGFSLNSSSCLLWRAQRDMPLTPVLKQLAPDPIIWHGNGAGKRTFWHYSGVVFDCFLHARNMTKDQFISQYYQRS